MEKEVFRKQVQRRRWVLLFFISMMVLICSVPGTKGFWSHTP